MESRKKQVKLIIEKMKKIAKARTYLDLGQLFDGISSAAISGAIARNKIPERWFEIIEDRYGVTRNSLVKAAEEHLEGEGLDSNDVSLAKQVDTEELLSVYRQLNEARRTLDEVRIEKEQLMTDKEQLVKQIGQLQIELERSKGKQGKEIQSSSRVHTTAAAARLSSKITE